MNDSHALKAIANAQRRSIIICDLDDQMDSIGRIRARVISPNLEEQGSKEIKIPETGEVDRWELKAGGHENQDQDILLLFQACHFNVLAPPLCLISESQGKVSPPAQQKIAVHVE